MAETAEEVSVPSHIALLYEIFFMVFDFDAVERVFTWN
jgi:hypothetical protein